MKWLGYPAKIMFINIAENTTLNGTTIRELFPALIQTADIRLKDYT